MRHRQKFLFAAAGILVWTTAIGTAAADSYRVPRSGNPALVATAPPGWTGQYTAKDEVTISDAANLAILEISVISDPALTAKPLPDVAAQVFRSADLSPRWTDTAPDTIAGLPGQAFIVPIVRNGAPVGVARVILAKIDASHVARLTEITILKETTSEELAGLKDIVSHLRISSR